MITTSLYIIPLHTPLSFQSIPNSSLLFLFSLSSFFFFCLVHRFIVLILSQNMVNSLSNQERSRELKVFQRIIHFYLTKSLAIIYIVILYFFIGLLFFFEILWKVEILILLFINLYILLFIYLFFIYLLFYLFLSSFFLIIQISLFENLKFVEFDIKKLSDAPLITTFSN